MMMKLSILPIAVLISTNAIAGSAVMLPEPSPQVMAAPSLVSSVYDWSGLYVGGVVSFDSGERDYDEINTFPYDAVTNYGGFAGYNFQSGAIVYGAEVSATTGTFIPVGFPDENHTYFLDVKARVGYAAGNALIYAAAGGSWSHFATDLDYNLSGFNYGAGVDYAFGEHMFAGIEYMARNVSGYRGGDTSDTHAVVTTQSIQLRIGYNF